MLLSGVVNSEIDFQTYLSHAELCSVALQGNSGFIHLGSYYSFIFVVLANNYISKNYIVLKLIAELPESTLTCRTWRSCDIIALPVVLSAWSLIMHGFNVIITNRNVHQHY